MKSNFVQETTVAFILVILLLIILNPFHLWMPDMIHVMVIIGLIAVFALFASFILREQASDEREGVHRMLAGRIGYLTGSAILIIGIVAQVLHNAVDIWLILTLVGMVLAKIGTRIYSDWNL